MRLAGPDDVMHNVVLHPGTVFAINGRCCHSGMPWFGGPPDGLQKLLVCYVAVDGLRSFHTQTLPLKETGSGVGAKRMEQLRVQLQTGRGADCCLGPLGVYR